VKCTTLQIIYSVRYFYTLDWLQARLGTTLAQD